jgi:predicted 3-demethylubiquinone-9 3-methyltransferase (glyoxalase superfamily)
MSIRQAQDKQKIIPHLWYDKEAKEAAEFYVSVFGMGGGNAESKVTNVYTLKNTPSGDCDVVSFQLWGYSFMSISAGPYFKFNPAISFMVNFDPSQDPNAKTRIDEMWAKLMEGGKALMPLDKYPFSERYGWVQDKYGLSWQLMLTKPEGEERQLIIPSMLFVGDVCGKAEEATDFYISVFHNAPSTSSGQAKRGAIARYPAGMSPDKEGTIMFTDFMLQGQWFAAMDSAHLHDFKFNEAVSLIVNCNDQQELDYYWEKLSAVPEAEQCGWLKDKYGVLWQITPKNMDDMMQQGTPEQIERVTQAFLKMKKFDLAELEKAYKGE